MPVLISPASSPAVAGRDPVTVRFGDVEDFLLTLGGLFCDVRSAVFGLAITDRRNRFAFSREIASLLETRSSERLRKRDPLPGTVSA